MQVAGDAAAFVFLRADHFLQHFLLAHRLLGFDALGHIAGDFDKTFNCAVFERLNHAGEEKARAVFADVNALVFDASALDCRLHLRRRNALRAIFGRKKNLAVTPDNLAFRVAEHFFRGRIN